MIAALRYVSAPEIQHVLAAAVAEMPRMVADSRTNALVLHGSQRSIDRCLALIQRLDVQVSADPAASPPRAKSIFPAVNEDLALDAGETASSSLLAILERYARSSGQHLVHETNVGARLANVKVEVQSSRRIAAAEVQGFVERLLIQHDFALVPLGGKDPHVFGVIATGNGSSSTARQRAYFLPIEDQALLLEHPAVLFTTLVALDRADANSLAGSLRATMTDSTMQTIAPAGDAILLSGTGTWLHGLVQAVHIADTRAASRTPSLTVRHATFVLEHARAQDIFPILREALQSAYRLRQTSQVQPQLPGMPQVVGPAAPPAVQLDGERNALLVTCDERDLDEIRALVAELDRK